MIDGVTALRGGGGGGVSENLSIAHHDHRSKTTNGTCQKLGTDPTLRTKPAMEYFYLLLHCGLNWGGGVGCFVLAPPYSKPKLE